MNIQPTQMIAVVAYKNSKKYKSIFKIFREYFAELSKENWFSEQDYYVFPDYIGFNRVLDCIDGHINNNHIFKYDYYAHSYNPFTKIHTYYPIYPLEIGIRLPSRIDITSNDVHKLALLTED